MQDQPVWHAPAARTVILAPHPDDESLGAGGLIASLRRRAIEVSVVAVTDGENAYPLSMDEDIVNRYQELDLYLRQSHAERDLETLARLINE